MSIWIWKNQGKRKDDYYSINLPFPFPAIGVSATLVISLATVFPLWGLSFVVALLAIGSLFLVLQVILWVWF